MNDDEFQQTLDRALRFLGARPRSEQEVRARLAQKGAAPEVVERVIARLGELRLIDDVAFAQFWIENRNRFRPMGSRALKAELRQKGLDRELIADQVEDAVDESTSVRAAARRQARRYAKLDYQTFRQKLFAHLARRGFAYDAISSAVEEAWREAGVEESGDPDEGAD